MSAITPFSIIWKTFQISSTIPSRSPYSKWKTRANHNRSWRSTLQKESMWLYSVTFSDVCRFFCWWSQSPEVAFSFPLGDGSHLFRFRLAFILVTVFSSFRGGLHHPSGLLSFKLFSNPKIILPFTACLGSYPDSSFIAVTTAVQDSVPNAYELLRNMRT